MLFRSEVNQANVKQIGNISDSKSFGVNPQTGRVYADDDLSPTLNTMQGGGREPKVMVKEATKKGHGIANTLVTGSEQATLIAKPQFGRLGKQAVETANNNKIEHGDCIEPYNKRVRSDELSGTLTTRPEGLKTAMIPVVETQSGYRIRKLTPRECWQLQAFPDELFDKAQQAGLSDSQLYKQAGNSVTVNVIEYIGKMIERGY